MSLELTRAVGERLKFGEFELAPDARSLWRRGEQVTLGSRALDILIALASRPGQILSKDDLTKSVWRGAFAGLFCEIRSSKIEPPASGRRWMVVQGQPHGGNTLRREDDKNNGRDTAG